MTMAYQAGYVPFGIRMSGKHNAWSGQVPRRPRSRKVIWSDGSRDLVNMRFEA